jgi:hypothetical protein
MSPQRSWLVVLLSIVLARSAAAQELIAGFEGGPSYGLGSVSPIFSVPFDATQAVIIKPTVSYLYYEKRTLLGESQITAPALSLGLGYRYNDEKFAFAAAPSIQVLWERQKNLFGPDTNRTRFGVLFAGDASYQAGPLTDLNVSASYDQANRYYWSRAGVKQRVTDLQFENTWALLLGPEGTLQGDKDVRQLSGGGVVEIDFKNATGFQIRGGYSWLSFADHSSDARPYFGGGVYHRF